MLKNPPPYFYTSYEEKEFLASLIVKLVLKFEQWQVIQTDRKAVEGFFHLCPALIKSNVAQKRTTAHPPETAAAFIDSDFNIHTLGLVLGYITSIP